MNTAGIGGAGATGTSLRRLADEMDIEVTWAGVREGRVGEVIIAEPGEVLADLPGSNTLRYRVRRAVALTGLDLEDPEHRIAAMLQLRLSHDAPRASPFPGG